MASGDPLMNARASLDCRLCTTTLERCTAASNANRARYPYSTPMVLFEAAQPLQVRSRRAFERKGGRAQHHEFERVPRDDAVGLTQVVAGRNACARSHEHGLESAFQRRHRAQQGDGKTGGSVKPCPSTRSTPAKSRLTLVSVPVYDAWNLSNNKVSTRMVPCQSKSSRRGRRR